MNKSHDKCLPQKSDKSAFTLAEVLITLGIIGVVAAMTLPAIVHNYKNRKLKQNLRNFIQQCHRQSKCQKSKTDLHFIGQNPRE